MDQLPAPDVSGITITSTSAYCDSETGATVSLSSSEDGITYVIYDALDAEVASVLGDGSSELAFDTLVPEGTYTIQAMRNGGNCEVSLATGFTVETVESPLVPEFAPELTYCKNSAEVSISNVQAGITYYLLDEGVSLAYPIDPELDPGVTGDEGSTITWDLSDEGLGEFMLSVLAENAEGCTVESPAFSVTIGEDVNDAFYYRLVITNRNTVPVTEVFLLASLIFRVRLIITCIGITGPLIICPVMSMGMRP